MQRTTVFTSYYTTGLQNIELLKSSFITSRQRTKHIFQIAKLFFEADCELKKSLDKQNRNLKNDI